MHKNILLVVLISMILWSCEDVVDVDLPQAKPKLVIDATGIQSENNENGTITLILSTTAPFFDDEIPLVADAKAELRVKEKTYPLQQNQKTKGIYTALVPMIHDQDYTLIIEYNEETYQGTTQLYSTVPIDYVTQENNTIDPDETSINAYFTDPPDEENYYYFAFITEEGKVQHNTDDKLIEGNQVSTFYADEFEPGDKVSIIINGISKRSNTYLTILNAQSGSSANPFATAPSTIRGNMVNITDKANFPLGYFRMSQQYQTIYTVQEKTK